MKPTIFTKLLGFLFLQLSGIIQGQPAEIKVTSVNYTDIDEFLLQGYKSVPDAATSGRGFPAVVVLPDWDGVYTYEQQRATMLADIGYVGFAADIYGINDHIVEDFARKVELATLYRSNVTLFVQRIKAAVNLVKTFDEVDPEKVAIIGYCFGGTGVMDYALTGQDDVSALVSFHGGLSMLPDAGPEIVPKLLVLSGGSDDTSTDIIDLENTLSAANGTWEITRYSGIEHGFTAFSSNAYDTWADERSWESMSTFLSEAFGITEYSGNQPSAFEVTGVDYTDVDGTELRGYLSLSNANVSAPAVIILPDWDGVNKYEKDRATMLAESGYTAFAADIYGADLQENLTFDQRVEQATLYRSDPALYNQRIQLAVDYVKGLPQVDTDNIALIGYCFGGTGVFEYAYTGVSDVKVVVSFHGGHQNLPRPMADVVPYVLVLSGGIDDAHGNQTEMENSLNDRETQWEITRYAKVNHGYTNWASEAYNPTADARSWHSMMKSFSSLLVGSTIPQTAIADGRFKTLVTALSAADLVGTLSKPERPFTVFAPTDDAFEALPAGLVDCLVKEENQVILSDILLNHVVEGKVRSTDLSDGKNVTTLIGNDVTVDLSGGMVKIGSSTVIIPDVGASNGVIHVIDSVLVPNNIDIGGFLATCTMTPMPTTSTAVLHYPHRDIFIGLLVCIFSVILPL